MLDPKSAKSAPVRWLTFLAISGSALAQTRTPAPGSTSNTDAPRPPAIKPGDPLPPKQDFNRVMDAPLSLAARWSDEVPRPGESATQVGEHGDTVLAQSNADPFYLDFAGGRYYPSASERLDPELVARATQLEAAGQTEVHGFVMFAVRMTPERMAILGNLGVRVLGEHPFYCLKAALPIAQLDRIAALDFVRWVGTPRATQKVHPNLSTAPVADDGRIDVFVDVFESDLGPQSTSQPVATLMANDLGLARAIDDPKLLPTKVQSNGPAQLALTALGLEVTEYLDGIRAFRARMLPSQMEALLALDFVQFVEPDIAPTLAHDESTPQVGNDLTRYYDNGNNSGVIAIGHADTGYDSAHAALSIYSWGWDFTGLGTAFADGCEHGTHTLGTILGSGYGSYGGSAKGVASGLARTSGQTRAYIARIFDNSCFFSGASMDSIMSVNRSGYWDGVYTSLRPVAINNSWGSQGVGWFGTEADPRSIDNEVYNQDQMYVFCAGNTGPSSQTIWQHATAKNAMTVGAVTDFYDGNSNFFPGNVADFSSRGPCGDGRWKPNVCAPGKWINSCDAGTTSGYRFEQGTSMATPHVTGIAAEIEDGVSWLRYQPAAVGAVLMSSAETKGGVTLTLPSDSHLRNYGAGRVEEHKALLGSSDYYWNTWAFNASWPNFQYADFTVPAGCVRITVCMNYYESAASAGAGQSLVNNWDLYIDDPFNGISGSGNVGEWTAQQSGIDNCEIRTLDNPTVGTWRWKAWPQNIALFSTVKMGVSVTFEFDTAHCNPYFDVWSGSYYLQPNQTAIVSAYAANYDGLATGASLDTYGNANISGAYGSLFDGSPTNYVGNIVGGREVELGDIFPGYARTCDFYVSWPTEGVQNFSSYLDIDNYGYLYDSVPFIVDGTPPPIPTGFGSYTHSTFTWSQNPLVYFSWNVPVDNLSGIQGYAFNYAYGYVPDPGFTITDGNVGTHAHTAVSSGSGLYVSMRPVDNCGNWNNSYTWSGPYYVDYTAPTQPGAISSNTHTVNYQSCSTTVNVIWSASSDSESGLANYWGVWDTSPSTDPTTGSFIGAGATNFSSNIGSSASPRYFHLRPLDYAGNFGPTRHFGPILANANSVSAYCTGKTNSIGCVPAISSLNQPDFSTGTFQVKCTNVLNNKFGLMFWGSGPNSAPFQGGTMCVLQPTVRTPSISSGGAASGNSCTGTYSFTWTTGYMLANGISVGDTLYCQWWMRDPASPSTTGLSNGLKFTVCD
jgi:hypothetical protein